VGEAQAGGQKGRGLGGRNFCPPVFVLFKDKDATKRPSLII